MSSLELVEAGFFTHPIEGKSFLDHLEGFFHIQTSRIDGGAMLTGGNGGDDKLQLVLLFKDFFFL